MTYCAKDVKVTHEVFSLVLPKALESCPHPASFAGMIAMGKSYLPVDEVSWGKGFSSVEGGG